MAVLELSPVVRCLALVSFGLKVIAEVLSSSHTSLCVPGAGVRTILSSSALEVLSMPGPWRMALTRAQGSFLPDPAPPVHAERSETKIRVFLFSL